MTIDPTTEKSAQSTAAGTANTGTASTSSTGTTTTATVIANVASALAAADTVARTRVDSLGLVQQARLAQFTRTAASATAQYGASSPQAQAAAAKVTSTQTTVARLAAVNRRIRLAPPQAASKGWTVYGHVYHSTLDPAPAYTVFFVDEHNAYQAAIGFTYTRPDGSYELAYSGSGENTSNIFLQIVNDKAQPVYISTTVFQPQTGAANYLDITLPAGEPILGDPPAAIRAVAMPRIAVAEQPPTTKKS